MALLLGLDIGSSTIKAALLDAETGHLVDSACAPDEELEIKAPKPGFAEQDPDLWWNCVQSACAKLFAKHPARAEAVAAIGIAYQMHGLVLVDKQGTPLRPAIIWCDSRAAEYGSKAASALGEDFCLKHYLNLPGNFTAAKLAWIKAHEPKLLHRADRALLPGDFIALKLTGEMQTTISGLSEGIFWDFKQHAIAFDLLSYFEINPELLTAPSATFGHQGELTRKAANALGLRQGIPVSYRAGDQPNNAFSLGVMRPGELAATAGTSAVVYGVGDKLSADPKQRVNTFAHVNYSKENPSLGILLCVNGCGCLYRWLRTNMCSAAGTESYSDMNAAAASAPPGANGVQVFPYGNGIERSLGNRGGEAAITALDLNRHTRADILRGAQEGIAFALHTGLDGMRAMGVELKKIKAGNANLFLSPLFPKIVSALTGARIELYDTDGAQGAARGAGLGAGVFKSEQEAFRGLTQRAVIEPEIDLAQRYRELYTAWYLSLKNIYGINDEQATITA